MMKIVRAGLIFQESNKMILKTISFITLTFFIAGCTSSPEKSVEDLYDAIKTGNMQKLSRTTMDKTTGMFALAALRDCSIDKSFYKEDIELVEACLVEEYGDITFKSVKISMVSEDEADAIVSFIQDSSEQNIRLKVYKLDDLWKVSIGEDNVTKPQAQSL